MLRTPVALIGLAGAAFLAGSLASTSFSLASLGQPQEFLERMLLSQEPALAKGDRMASPRPANRTPVSIVELVGVANATVILRGREGEILYRSDPRSGITTFSKNVELPVITLKEEAQSPVVQHPAPRKEGTEVPQDGGRKPRNLVGCMGDVSPLARASADRMPSLCLASLDLSSL